MDNKKTNIDDILLILAFGCGIAWTLTGGLLLIVYGFVLFASFYIFGMILEKKRKHIKDYRLGPWIKAALILLCLSFMVTVAYYLIPEVGTGIALKSLLTLPSLLIFPLMIALPIAVHFDNR